MALKLVLMLFCLIEFALAVPSNKDTYPWVEEVHLVFMTHLDMGYTNFAKNICELYFYSHFPAAINTSMTLRQRGGEERFIYTSHPWLIMEYLDGAVGCTDKKRTPQEIKLVVDAIERGDITWHAKPFNMLPEASDKRLFSYGLTLGHTLDKMFNKPLKTAASSKDVVGVSRSIIPLLLNENITALHIGANAICTAPADPLAFVWQHEGRQLLTMLHTGYPSYGGTVILPGFKHALVYDFTQDNLAPQTADYVIKLWASLKQQFPNAAIKASSLDAFSQQLWTFKDKLPVVTSEMGDTWIYGIGADPFRVSLFREITRTFYDSQISAKLARISGPISEAYQRRLMMIPEHNWGLSNIIYLDHEHYFDIWTNEDFAKHRSDFQYQRLEQGWAEHRSYLMNNTQFLRRFTSDTEALKIGAMLDEKVKRVMPNYRQHIEELQSMHVIEARQQIYGTKHFAVAFNSSNGCINFLQQKHNQRVWADPDHVLAHFIYQTYAMADFNDFNRQYTPTCVPCGDFSKPGMDSANPERKDWEPQLVSFLHKKTSEGHDVFVAQLKLDPVASIKYGAPQQIYVRYEFDRHAPVIRIELNWYLKTATRLAEAMWLKFNPIVKSPQKWQFDVLGSFINPLDVVVNGSQHLHAIQEIVKNEEFAIRSLDAPLVAPGDTNHLLNFAGASKPQIENGVHFNIFNNLWGTAFNQWYDQDAKFSLHLVDLKLNEP